MKYFLDFEFIEGFHKPLLGKRRHFIDLISIGMVSEDNRGLYFISSEYNYNDADEWVKGNVIQKAYLHAVHGDNRNHYSTNNFHKHYGVSLKNITEEVLCFVYPNTFKEFGAKGRKEFVSRTKEYGWNEGPIEFYGYYSDYDWVLFCSLFGRMIDLPKGFPMYCIDLKQEIDRIQNQISIRDKKIIDLKLHLNYPKQSNEHLAINDAAWNKSLYDFLQTL